MSKNTYITLALLALACTPLQEAQATSMYQPVTTTEVPATPAKAYFVNLKNNDKVTSPFTVQFGIEGMKISPSGKNKSGTGHFHLLIDTELTEAQKNTSIPTDVKHLDFGQGQSQTNLVLTPGKHTLQIVMGDGAHKLHNPSVMSEVITIEVK